MPPTLRLPARLDPALAGLVALVVYALHGFNGTLDRDQGTFVYAGEGVARGVLPFVAIFNSVGPVGDLVTGAGIRLGAVVGVGPVLASRLTYLVVSALAVALLSLLAREALGSRLAGVVAPALFLTFESFIRLATGGPREKAVMVVFLELALLLLLRRRWLWAGILTALATLTWQPSLLSALAAALVALLSGGLAAGPRWRALASYVVGGLLPTALLVMVYAVSGHLRMAWWGFFVVNVGYTRQPTIVESWARVTDDYRLSTWLVVGGWVLILVLGVVAVLRLRRSPAPVDRALLVLGAGALVAGAWSCYALNGGADLFVVLPYAALGLAGGLLEATRRLSRTTAAQVGAAVAVLAVIGAGAESVTSRDSRLPTERRDVTAMTALLPAGSGLVSVHAPEVMVLAGRRNPTPWQLSDSAIAPFMDAHLPGGLVGLARQIRDEHPGLIALGRHAVKGWVTPLLRADYVKVGKGDHWAWYASASLAPDVRHRMRRVNDTIWQRAARHG